MLELVDQLCQSFDSNEYTIGVFIDLSKAFDTVDHQILLKKLYHYGARGINLQWFESYLSHRKQFIAQDDNENSENPNMLLVKCGVPQGSI